MAKYTIEHGGEFRELLGESSPTVAMTTTAELPAGKLRFCGEHSRWIAVQHVESRAIFIIPWTQVLLIESQIIQPTPEP